MLKYHPLTPEWSFPSNTRQPKDPVRRYRKKGYLNVDPLEAVGKERPQRFTKSLVEIEVFLLDLHAIHTFLLSNKKYPNRGKAIIRQWHCNKLR